MGEPEIVRTQNFLRLNDLCLIDMPEGELMGTGGMDKKTVREIVESFRELKSPEEIEQFERLGMVEEKIYEKFGYGEDLVRGIKAKLMAEAVGKPNRPAIYQRAMEIAAEVDAFYYELAYAKPVETLHYLREKAHARGMSDEHIIALGDSDVAVGKPKSKEEFENNLMAELMTYLKKSTNSRLGYLSRMREVYREQGSGMKNEQKKRFVMDFLLRGVDVLQQQLRRTITLDSGNLVRQASTQTAYHAVENFLKEE